ncbi:hypothetical protein ABZ891_32070 [Streptomyces sp. NPDC047023]|uniref:hypothetical protein n=1 Tax=Streptomyces sp. NPDC047023 TaxID=3155139 RepID=UPI0033EEB4D0
MNAGLGETRDELLANIGESRSRATARSHHAQRSIAALARAEAASGAEDLRGRARNQAARAKQAAGEAERILARARMTDSLEQLRDLEREILRLETLADASALAVTHYLRLL